MNGMHAGNMPAAMVGLPTPAGHQAELNYIYGLVEELSRQLAQNQRALEEVVSGVGKVRGRARSQSLTNDELLNAAGEELKNQDENIDQLVSILTEALEKAKFSRDANAALLSQYSQVMYTMLKKFHEYKAKHVQDVAAWHHSYRAQLAEARAENCRLREQIWEMQAHAGKANEIVRKFRAEYDKDEKRWERTVDAKAMRQELRFWKRMAMPELPDDDEFWSDDDDIIDKAEKERQKELQKLDAEQQAQAAQAVAEEVAANEAAESSGMGELGGNNGPVTGVPPEVPQPPVS